LDPIQHQAPEGEPTPKAKLAAGFPEAVPQSTPQTDLKAAAEQEANVPLWKDFGYFLLYNKKWWLLPIIVIVILLSLIMALSSTAIAPFIYTVF